MFSDVIIVIDVVVLDVINHYCWWCIEWLKEAPFFLLFAGGFIPAICFYQIALCVYLAEMAITVVVFVRSSVFNEYVA